MIRNRKIRYYISRYFHLVDKFAFKTDLQHRKRYYNYRTICMKQKANLTADEKTAIRNVWGKSWGGQLESYRFYKAMCGEVNPHFVPDDFYAYAERVLNLRWSAYFLQHKCLLKATIPARNRAKVLLQKIDGHFVTEGNEEMSKAQAKEILSSCPEFMAKVARATGGGKGVRKIVWDKISNKEEVLSDIMYPIDMEYELVLRQHEFMAQFNPDSINTFRIITLNINEHCSVISTFMRMGAKGSFVDNMCSGGVTVGVDKEGNISEYGVDESFDKHLKSPSGLTFKGMKVPDFETIKQKVIALHKRIPYANLIGWDISLDETGEVIVVEMNLDGAILQQHQIFNGPIFGDRIEEVKAYIKEREPLLRHQMMLY